MTDAIKEPPASEDFVETSATAPAKKPSTGAKIRKGVLLFALVVCLLGLGWEYLVARPGYQRVVTYLGELEENFNESSTVETIGDAEGKGINSDFLAKEIREKIGIKPARSVPFGDGAAVVEYYEWRRGNLYEVYDVAVMFRQQGPNKTMVFSDWYDDIEEVPANPAAAEFFQGDISSIELPPEPMAVGAGPGGGGGGRAGRRGRGGNNPDDDSNSENNEQQDDSENGTSGDSDKKDDTEAEKEDGTKSDESKSDNTESDNTESDNTESKGDAGDGAGSTESDAQGDTQSDGQGDSGTAAAKSDSDQ